MMISKRLIATSLLACAALSMPVNAQSANEQFFPLLTYRTGPYGPNGAPWANGAVDYLKLVNARDGGVNGVKLTWEECEFGYATGRGVECYERLKNKGPTGGTVIQPLSTGVTFALTEKTEADKIPLLTSGYGRADSADGTIFKWNFPLLGTYWSAADILVQHVGDINGGLDKLKGKSIALVYHDSPYGKEPIPLLEKRAQMHGFKLELIPVTHPGVEQKSAWLKVRRSRPDYVFLWGWGVMNSTAIKEAVAVGYPRNKMYGVWWSGAEQDVRPAGKGAKGYNALTLQHAAGLHDVHNDVLKHVHDKNNGTGPRNEVGEILYTRGLMQQMLAVEAVRIAQKKYGNKPLTGEQVRWGLENLDLSQDYLNTLGFAGVMRSVRTSCSDHQGPGWGRIQSWDGKQWNVSNVWYQADNSVVDPVVQASANKYANSKGITPRNCS